MRAKILPLATFHNAHLCKNGLIRFALPISMPRFKSIIFHQYSLKIKLFLKKKAKFSCAGGSAPKPPCLQRLGSLPHTPSSPPIAPRISLPPFPPAPRISDYAPAALCTVYNYMDFCSFCFEQFFLDCSVANLIMITIDICLIVFCLKSLFALRTV